jgi:uncharacterized protein DUF6343
MAGTGGWWGTRPENGTPDSPRSALNLRLVLALFGLISCSVLAALCFRAHLTALALVLTVLAVIAAADLAAIQRRRIERRRREPGERPSLFE